ncbi:MAG: hypothetical protein NC829_00780, partial [Candidatus Omnitrophica bacterium]|nr:hypothetical protein [Candidatus Omnitrophota bacterium]
MSEGNLEYLSAKSINFAIADINFSMSFEYPARIDWFWKNYRSFISYNHHKEKVFIVVKAIQKDNEDLTVADRHFSLNLKYGTVFKIRGNFSNGQFIVEARKGVDLSGLIRVLTSAVLIEKGGFLLHACGVAQDNRGYVFCGPSESGKTTI